MQNVTDSLVSLTDNQDNQQINSISTKTKASFQFRRVLLFIIISIADIMVFFQRACPTVVTDELAEAYHVKVSQLGIFTSMFYIPFSILQLFAGLLADVLEPSLIIGSSLIFSSIGGIICGLSNSLIVGCIGRIIVGAGCGLIYSPCTRCIMNWFPLVHYSKFLGGFLFIAGLGNFLAQTPLTLLAGVIGWRWCFISISIFAIFISIITYIFVRGNPIVYGYPPVNSDLSQNVHKLTFKQRFHQLMVNFKTIFSNSNFWLILIFVFFCNGSFYNVNGIWGGPFLKERLSYSSVKASNALLGLSLGNNFGALLNPYVPDFTCRSKKWTTFCYAVISIACCFPLAFCPEKLSFPIVVSLFTLFAVTSAGVGVIAYPLGIELFHPARGASASGCLNCFAFLSSIIFMPLTGKILESFGYVKGSDEVHNPDGFKYGLWIFNIVGFSFGTFLFLFVRKPKNDDKVIENASNYDSLN